MSELRDPSGDGSEAIEDALDIEVARVLDAYLAAVEAGGSAQPQRLLRDHPEIADRLRACLRVLGIAEGTASALSSAGLSPGPDVTKERDAPGLELGHDFAWDEADPTDPQSAPAARPPRYQVLGELARGGIGVVLRGRDPALGRELALKVLQERHRADPGVVQRFVEEAQIGGQLQHPGIVPIYDLGRLADRRPFIAMKLVQGRTLAALLAARPDPAQDRPRLLGIFEQVCQTMAYAHSRGVIHRDLKPSNIMVGGFGEVQVMDWGLAKVLRGRGANGGAGGPAASDPPSSSDAVRTIRGDSDGDDSRDGSVLGTVAYMAPEQARGEVGAVDERADVFGLGALLCEILTGLPPFAAATRSESHALAVRGDPDAAHRRLESSGAEPELLQLARDCLSPDPADRPGDAGAVAQRMSAYLAGVQERLRAAELERVEAQARAAAERRQRRLQVGLATSLLGLVALASGGGLYQMQQRARQRQHTSEGVNTVLDRVAGLRSQALVAPEGDSSGWDRALSELQVADDVLRQGRPDRALGARVGRVRAELERGRSAAEQQARVILTERTLLAQLETVRGERARDPDFERADREYLAVFRAFGLDPDTATPEAFTAALAGRPAAPEIAAALDDWCWVRRIRQGKDEPAWTKLADAARAIDPDPWRNRLRALYGVPFAEAKPRLDAFASDSDSLSQQPAFSLVLLADMLSRAGESDQAAQVLRDAWRRFPGDFWVNISLAMNSWSEANQQFSRSEEAFQFLRAAVALRPESPAAHAELGHALMTTRELDAAIAEYRTAIRLNADDPVAHNNLGNALCAKGETDAAIAELRTAIGLKADFSGAYTNLGNALRAKGEIDAAIAAYRTSIGLKADLPEAHNNLAIALIAKGEPDAAIAELRTAIKLKADLPGFHSNLGKALRAKGEIDAAIAELRTAIGLKADHPGAHYDLGLALYDKGDIDQAVAEYRTAIRIKPDYHEAHNDLGNALYDKGDTDGAMAEYRTTIRLKPDYPNAHSDLGNALLRVKGDIDGAIAEHRTAIRLKPDYAEPHNNLGTALFEKGDIDGAIEEYRTTIRLKPDYPTAHCNLGNTLRVKGDIDGAIEEYRTTIRLKPDYAKAHSGSGIALVAKGDIDGAIAEFRAALRLDPDNPESQANLGLTLRSRGDYQGALSALRRAVALAPPGSPVARALPEMIREIEPVAALAGRLPAVLEGKDRPRNADEGTHLANMAYKKGYHAAAARLWDEALAADPKLADDRQAQHRYNAACAAGLAGCGQGHDNPPPDESERAKLRARARDWLRAELDVWSKILDSGSPQARPTIASILKHWEEDTDLAGVRDPAALAHLPEAERPAWQALWADVERALDRAHDNPSRVTVRPAGELPTDVFAH
jgi:serine/threonine-protein kinase